MHGAAVQSAARFLRSFFRKSPGFMGLRGARFIRYRMGRINRVTVQRFESKQ